MIYQKKLLETELRFDTSTDKLYRFNKRFKKWTHINPTKRYDNYHKKYVFNHVGIDKKKFFIYRLIYYVRFNHFDIFDTKIQIDHINNDHNDNRLENLRTCNNRQNNQNRKYFNGGEIKGYSVTKYGTFQARYRLENGKEKTKTFKKEENAIKWYLENRVRF